MKRTLLGQLRHLEVNGVGWLRARRLLLSGAKLGRRVVVEGALHFVGEGDVTIGNSVTLVRGPIATEIVTHRGSRFVLGDAATVNYGASFEAWESILIGKRCMVASHVRVTDRDRGRTAPILIEDDVWLAHGAFVGPGVTIGQGSVVAAGAVVMGDVPPGRLAIGNPARTMSLDLTGKSDKR